MRLLTRFEHTCSRLHGLVLRWHGIKTGERCAIAMGARVRLTWLRSGIGRIVLGPKCDIRSGAVLESWGGEIAVGQNVFIGPHAVLYGHGGIVIGDHALISMHVCILSSNHAIPEQGTLIRSQPDDLRPTRLGRDVWIGAHAVILGGVTLGDGCIVGAGAVVTKDLPAGAIAHGVPAQVRGFRNRA